MRNERNKNVKLTWIGSCECAGIDFRAPELEVDDLNDTPEYLGFGPVYVGGLLLVANPVLMGSVVCLDREVGCCSDVSRGGGGLRNADSGVLARWPFLGC